MNIETIKTVVSIALALFIVGVVSTIDIHMGRTQEQRLHRIEARLDSLTHTTDSLGFRADKVGAVVRNLVDVQSDAVQSRIYDTLTAVVASRATMRFVMADSSVVIGNWSDMQSRVWDIRRAEPLPK